MFVFDVRINTSYGLFKGHEETRCSLCDNATFDMCVNGQGQFWLTCAQCGCTSAKVEGARDALARVVLDHMKAEQEKNEV